VNDPTLPASLPPAVLRARLCRAQRDLAELEGRCPGALAGDLSSVLDTIETVLADRFSWRDPRPLTAHDLAYLAALGVPS
jgi:hypothetical protein